MLAYDAIKEGRFVRSVRGSTGLKWDMSCTSAPSTPTLEQQTDQLRAQIARSQAEDGQHRADRTARRRLHRPRQAPESSFHPNLHLPEFSAGDALVKAIVKRSKKVVSCRERSGCKARGYKDCLNPISEAHGFRSRLSVRFLRWPTLERNCFA